MNLPVETPNVQVIARAIDVVFIQRVKDDPATITLIDLKEAAGCPGLSDDRAVVLRAPTEIESIARRHIQVIEHRYRKTIAAILPVRTAILADVQATIVSIIDATRN